MSSSSSSPSAPAISSRWWKYHVFLSFKGEDTRKTFVDNLYAALKQRGIYTYKDDETLPRGESIGPCLVNAIEESLIAVIVFSENYADSTWCLDELVHIMKCKEKKGQIVMPIFYDVQPSDVRKQKRKYEEAFTKYESVNKNKVNSWSQSVLERIWAPQQNNHEAFEEYELENKTKVGSWRKALVDATNISGWVTKHIANGHEAKAIEVIVDEISQKLQPVTSSANDNLIGMEARMQDLKSKLKIGSGGVRMIGIWGVGGGGKTTLASCIYDEICGQFDGCCFVENIREESIRYGLGKLQENVLSSVLKQKQAQVGRVEDGRRMMMDRFCHRKVLIVLDDVNHLEQLEALAGSHHWFGKESRIIITTRDEHLLNAHKVDAKHDISLLNEEEALALFRKHSPQDNRPMEDYEVLSKKVVSYAGGLPLALTVLGRFLCDKDVIEWRSALDKLKEIPDPNIQDVLKVSYDGLEQVQKDLFLDIACFCRGVDKEKAMKVHHACGFHPVSGVKVLIQKALLSISDGKFDMHDLVQEMAYNIVRGAHHNNPAKHSRVWKKGDVLKICAMDATTELDMIKAIRFRCSRADPLQRLPLIVANMNNVRWIDWGCDLASPLPTNFSPRELCCLTLKGISQKQLWDGHKHLLNLKMMELDGLRNLIMTPKFDGLPNLERFKLTKCSYLEEIDSSIGSLESLVFLSVKRCFGLKMFPPITRLEKLEALTFSRCPSLFKLRGIQQQNTNHIGLQFSHSGLKKLDLSYCELGDEDIGSVVWELPNLEKLDISGNRFSRLNFSLLQLPQLKWVNISYCERLVELSELPSSIAVLIADHCTSLDTFGDFSKCKWLWKVSHRKGNKLVGDILLPPLLQGNATEDHFISVVVEHQNPEGFVGRLFRGKTYKLHLLRGWYRDYCGFLICLVTNMKSPHINISIKQEVDEEDSRFDLRQEFNYDTVEPEYDGTTTSIGYVSFNSLRHPALLTSSNNCIISFSVEDRFSGSKAAKSYVRAKLIRRESRNDQVQATKDCSKFWDEERKHGNTFTVEHDSESSIKIQWFPYDNRF